MTDDFDVEDIGAMRKQGDLRGFLRSQMRAGPGAAKKPQEWKPPPGHQPGAWPAGIRPVDLGHRLDGWGPEWDAALEDYREYLRTRTDDEEE